MESRTRGRYQLNLIARGGMGCAYRAQVGQRNCFIKEVALDQRDKVRHLKAEALMLQRLPLGNFPRFVELFEEEGHIYLVSEFLEGLTLEQEIQRNPWVFPNEKEIRQLACDLCRQLEILHALKPPILYLDMKPSNLIRSPKGAIFLVDFGISRAYLPPFTLGDFQGSPQTASPEHFTGKLEPRSDLFCLAATVHYFATRGQAERLEFGAFDCVREYHPEVSDELAAWLARCLKLDLHARYPSVQAARRALEGVNEEDTPKTKKSWLPWKKG